MQVALLRCSSTAALEDADPIALVNKSLLELGLCCSACSLRALLRVGRLADPLFVYIGLGCLHEDLGCHNWSCWCRLSN